MHALKKLSLYLLLFGLSSCGLRRTFPDFELRDSEAQIYSKEQFKSPVTIVIMGHLECPPMLQALRDSDYFHEHLDTLHHPIMAILENTEEHIQHFYSDSSSIWSYWRKSFKIDSLQFPMLAECDKENIKYETDGSMTIGHHCRHLAWKIWAFSSPTLFLIDPDGKILKKQKGYPLYGNAELRRQWIFDFLNTENIDMKVKDRL